ncbi:vacuolar protein-sorting-associated protein 25 [Ceratobasidium sp. AG-Ba]|nr:vacuolar protein-sorting-associated protein 25 [Ceratobasidium sp. AG-Ba]
MQTLSTFKTASGFTLPSIHSYHALFVHQPNPTTEASSFAVWSQLITSYARFRNLFTLRAEDAGIKDGLWAEILINPRINRGLTEKHLETILAKLVANKMAEFEPSNQTRSVIVYWRRPEEWAEALHDWANQTGQLNTILTLYEIQNPDVPSAFTDIPLPLLRRAIDILMRTSRAQYIEGTAGGHMGAAYSAEHWKNRQAWMKIHWSSTVRKYGDVSQDEPCGGEVPRHSEWVEHAVLIARKEIKRH